MAPAPQFSALPAGILVAFKAFENVIAGDPSGFRCGYGGVMRTDAAAADEKYLRFTVDLLSQLGQKIQIGMSVRPALPFDLDGARDAPDPRPFGTGSHVDDTSSGRDLP